MINKKRFLKILGAHVRKLRQDRGLTQKALSNKMDKDLQSLQRVERGAINPSVYYLLEIANALEISLSKLFDFEFQ